MLLGESLVEQFDIFKWRSCVSLPPDFVPPRDANIMIWLDSSPTSGPQSDESAFVCGYKFPQGESNVLTVLDMSSQKWPDGSLADEALRMIQKWNPVEFRYENIPGMDWFKALLLLKADVSQISLPPVCPFTPRNVKGIKDRRIWALNDLFKCNPPAIAFRRDSYCEKLFAQVEKFKFGGDAKGQENGLLDVLGMSAGF